MINAMTVDFEFWYSGEPFSNYCTSVHDKNSDQVIEATMPLLHLFDKYDVRATFFVLGKTAEELPDLVKEIYERGHEIASHGYSHTILHKLNEEEFEAEIKKSVDLLNRITGERPIGFRAPSFSIDNSTKWAFNVLIKYNFKYDSSIFPYKTRLYGVPTAPLEPYKPSKEDVSKIDPDSPIVEFPLTVVNILGKNVPISGGYYFRILPLWFIVGGIRKVNREGRPAVFYIHPWETYPATPKVLPFPQNVRIYHGIKSSLKRLEKLLQRFSFAPIKEVLQIE